MSDDSNKGYTAKQRAAMNNLVAGKSHATAPVRVAASASSAEETRLSKQVEQIDAFLTPKIRDGSLNEYCDVSKDINAANTYESDRLDEAVALDSCIADLKDQLKGSGIDSTLIDSKLNPHVTALEDIAPNIAKERGVKTDDIVPGFTKR